MHQNSDKHNGRGSFLPRLTVYALLAVIITSGAWLRFAHDDWDGGNQLHPDERGILFVAQDIDVPARLADALNPHQSLLNPFRTPQGVERLYPYGHFQLYTMILAQRLLGEVCSGIGPICRNIPATSFAGRLLNLSGLPRFDHLMTVSRALSALFDTLTIVAAWLLATEVFGSRAGLAAAAFCSAAVLHVQNAHFGTVDSGLALFATLCLWLLVRAVRVHHSRDAILAGVCAGLALGCKISAVLLVFPAGAAYLGQKGIAWARRRLWLTLGAAVLTFVLANPYALLDPGPFVNSLATQAAVTSGALDWPFTRQYIGTLPVGYAIEQQARWGLGLPLTIAGYGGLVWAAWRATGGRSREMLVMVVWSVAILVGGGAALIKFPRYLLPLTPTLFTFAGGILTLPWTAGGKERHAVGWLRRACLVMVMVPTMLYALAFEGMYRQPHPWVAASQWIYREFPSGTHVAVEQGDDALPLNVTIGNRFYLAREHVDACTLDPIAEPDDGAKLRRMLECLARADFLIQSSNRHYGVIPRLAGRYPLTTGYYRALFAGRLGFKMERSFRRSPTLLGWSLVDDPFAWAGLANPLVGWGNRATNLGPADESLVVYDHPLVLVFANRERLSVEEMMSRLRAGIDSLGDGAGQTP